MLDYFRTFQNSQIQIEFQINDQTDSWRALGQQINSWRDFMQR